MLVSNFTLSSGGGGGLGEKLDFCAATITNGNIASRPMDAEDMWIECLVAMKEGYRKRGNLRPELGPINMSHPWEILYPGGSKKTRWHSVIFPATDTRETCGYDEYTRLSPWPLSRQRYAGNESQLRGVYYIRLTNACKKKDWLMFCDTYTCSALFFLRARRRDRIG